MSAPKPKSILKQPTASFPVGPSQSQSHPHGSKPRVGSKLKHTVALRAEDGGSSKSRDTGKTKPRARVVDHDDEDEDEDEDMSAEDEASDEDDDVSTGDEIERAKEKAGRKKAPTKRKAATTADTFGATLTSLLTEPAGGRAGPSKRQRRAVGAAGEEPEHYQAEADAPSFTPSLSLSAPARGSAPILSLSRTTLPPSRKELSLERKAARILKAEKAEREDRARVKDVVEGWALPGGGMEFEKGLRKTAQRGGE
ncbi:hypothetical protein EHS25_007105 [Saitozyma podzolica]|uniref:Uncharacterized protein n=1 Tax=Saitozyma podzolica TaxID=1890683 RepID=A0A427XPK5_9TREE|nr:hypothetical protein EHS25_007105 [Saitozyma podzolica]